MATRRTQIQPTAPTPIAVDHWTIKAACRDVEPELFFVDGDGRWDSTRHADQRALAGQVCAPCPVRSECLRAAIDEDDQHAFRGGATPNERARLARRGVA